MQEIQTFEAPDGVLAFLFLQDHRAYAEGDIVGLKVAIGDQLAETFMTTQKVGQDPKKTAICRRATERDLSIWSNRHATPKTQAEPLVAVEFETDVGSYRGPGGGRKADVAGFPRKIADQYCLGYLLNGQPVGKVAHYFIAPEKMDVDTELEAPELEKPRKVQPRKTKRRKTALDKSPRTAAIK